MVSNELSISCTNFKLVSANSVYNFTKNQFLNYFKSRKFAERKELTISFFYIRWTIGSSFAFDAKIGHQSTRVHKLLYDRLQIVDSFEIDRELKFLQIVQSEQTRLDQRKQMIWKRTKYYFQNPRTYFWKSRTYSDNSKSADIFLKTADTFLKTADVFLKTADLFLKTADIFQ